MRYAFALLCLAPVLVAAVPPATASAPRAAVTRPASVTRDFSTPQKAAGSFLAAMQAHEGAAVRECLTIPAAHKTSVDAFLGMTSAMWRLESVAAAKFPNDGAKVFGSAANTDVLAARLRGIDSAQVAIEGDKATLEIPGDAAMSQAKGTVTLHKEGGAWKLDAASLFGLDRIPPAQVEANLALTKKLTGITGEVIKEIEGGKYFSAADAYKTYWLRCAEAARATPGSPVTPAAAAPATTNGN